MHRTYQNMSGGKKFLLAMCQDMECPSCMSEHKVKDFYFRYWTVEYDIGKVNFGK